MHYNKDWTFLTIEEFKTVRDSFELKNEKREQDRRMWLWGWQKQPTKILHWKKLNWYISIPSWLRGFWDFNNQYWNIKKVEHPELINPYKWNELDLKQDKFIEELLQNDIWYWHCSTWIWKTFITAKIISIKSVKTLIVVSWIELMRQMQKDLEDIFWEKYPTINWTTWIVKKILIPDQELEADISKWESLIANETSPFKLKRLKKKLSILKKERKFTEEINYKKLDKVLSSNIVIANIDTLVTLPKEEFFQKFDLTIMDEVDSYLSADRRREMIWEKINSKFTYWLTWTIKLNYISDKVFEMYLWPKSSLIEKHFSPNIYKVMTDFSYHLDDMKKFHELKEAVYWSESRNNLIINTIVKTLWKSKWILFSEYIEHAKHLKEQLENKWVKCFMLIWEVKKADRIRIKKELKEYKWACILIGSVKVVWRWFNVPELSVWYLTTVEKFKSNIEQYVWRIIRKFPWKTEAIWYDFIDPWCRVLLNQSKARNTTYRKEFPNSKIEFYS